MQTVVLLRHTGCKNALAPNMKELSVRLASEPKASRLLLLFHPQ